MSVSIKLIDGEDPKSLYQYDIGRQIQIITNGGETIKEVQFSNVRLPEALIVLPKLDELGNVIADVPNVFTLDPRRISVYLITYLENGECVKYKDELNVIPRKKPSDYVYTETEALNYSLLEKQINSLQSTKLTAPSTAQIGQIFRVQAINDDGTLTLEAVDMPSGGSGGAVDDVQINGQSIVGENGVAEIPIAANNQVYGLVRLNGYIYSGLEIATVAGINNVLRVVPAVNSYISNRKTFSPCPITISNLDYAVKAAMCDGKGEAWTADEQAMARKRMGIGDWELITEVNLDTETARYILCSCDEYDKINIFIKRDANNTSLTGNIQVIIIGKSDNVVCELFSKPNTGYMNTLFELNCINGYAFGTYMASNNLYSYPAHISPAFYVGSGNRYCVNIPSPSTACDGLSKMIVIGRRK